MEYIVRSTLHDLYCLYYSSQAILELSQSVSLLKSVCTNTCNPRHNATPYSTGRSVYNVSCIDVDWICLSLSNCLSPTTPFSHGFTYKKSNCCNITTLRHVSIWYLDWKLLSGLLEPRERLLLAIDVSTTCAEAIFKVKWLRSMKSMLWLCLIKTVFNSLVSSVKLSCELQTICALFVKVRTVVPLCQLGLYDVWSSTPSLSVCVAFL